MAHYAYVVDGVVQRVHVLANPVITDEDGVEVEALGQEFLANLHGYDPDQLIQCSYNGTFRGVFPGPGFIYSETLEKFIPPRTSIDTYTHAPPYWVAPVPYPDDGGEYTWDEDSTSWIEVTNATE